MKILAAFLSHALFSLVVGLGAAAFLGPEQFGRFALGLASAGFVQILAFDWLRLSATRFYSQAAREQRPHVRSVLDSGFVWIALTLACVGAGAIALFAPADLLWLAWAALGMTLLNGWFDYSAALARARFLDGVYVRLILVKNVASLVLVVGAAWATGSAAAALWGACGALALSIALAWRPLRDGPASAGELAHGQVRACARECARYSAPIVLASALYLAVPLMDRMWVAERWGYGQSGYFSLAFDIGWRILVAFGAALDVLLFQIAVRADEKSGASAARDQITRNCGILFAVLAPAAMGLWLIAPSLQSVFAPVEFHGPFLEYFTLLLPGFFCLALTSFGVQARFQIDKKTTPLLAAALIAFALNGLALAAPDPASVAMVQSLAFACALATLLVWRAKSGPMSPAQFLKASASTLLMALALQPLRAIEPGATALLVQAAMGAAIYGACVIVLDAGLRARLSQALEFAHRRR
jgi:O-antigen/teichoic acid export membrane protein